MDKKMLLKKLRELSKNELFVLVVSTALASFLGAYIAASSVLNAHFNPRPPRMSIFGCPGPRPPMFGQPMEPPRPPIFNNSRNNHNRVNTMPMPSVNSPQRGSTLPTTASPSKQNDSNAIKYPPPAPVQSQFGQRN